MLPDQLDRPSIMTPLEGQSMPLTPAAGAPEPTAPILDEPQPARPRGAYAATWQQGALVGLVSVSLLILMMVGVITVFSVMSSTLVTIDALLVSGLLVLSIALFILLVRSQRRQA